MDLNEKLKVISSWQDGGYYEDRIASELLYLSRLSLVRGGTFDDDISRACDDALACRERCGIGREDAERIEASLAHLSPVAKSLTAHCVSHAHIDMNWKWGYQETVAVVIETFRTMLMLMREYPEFTFAQSQASVYRIVEEFAPEMLDEIRERVHEGRWEVSASSWTECDKNMPSGESLVRQILYTKRYLGRLLDLDPDTLRLDFEPDTFGHNKNVPEILASGGVDYYYHCRGCDYRYVYRWQAESGREVLVYQDPKWYMGPVDSKGFCEYPLFCRDAAEGGIPVFLRVYGVGDHGGGPSRRDIERLIDMSRWPLLPTIRFSTYGAFFAELEKCRPRIKLVTGELNFVFTGCYTTQSRIKLANRLSEARLYDAEVLSSAATLLTGAPGRSNSFRRAWENVLFSQFHDILPGSGVLETREYCLGGFQRTIACANANANAAMHAIADGIDTSSIPFDDDRSTISEGGGVGFRIDSRFSYQFTSAEMGRGRVRVLHVFNTTRYRRCETAEFTVFDYSYDFDNLEIVNAAGATVPFRFLEVNRSYNHHRMTRFIMAVDVPPLGYATYILRQRSPYTAGKLARFEFRTDPRQDHMEDVPLVLENSRVRAVFDPSTVALISFTDKESGRELISAPSAMLRYAEENNRYGMSAWRVGSLMHSVMINEASNVRLTEVRTGGMARSLSYEMKYKQSTFGVTVSLWGENEVLDFEINADWHERGTQDTFVPQLAFVLPFGYDCEAYRADVPFGHITRPPLAHDVPVLSHMEALFAEDTGDEDETRDVDLQSVDNSPAERRHLMLVSDTKYGFTGYGNSVKVTLLRSSFAPDPLPESGKFRVKLGLAVASDAADAARISECYNHRMPQTVGLAHKGSLPLDGSFVTLEGAGVELSAIKPGEDGGVVVRLFNPTPADVDASIAFGASTAAPLTAELVDSNEHPLATLPVAGNAVSVRCPAFGVVAVRVK